jgi:hypothetical protein
MVSLKPQSLYSRGGGGGEPPVPIGYEPSYTAENEAIHMHLRHLIEIRDLVQNIEIICIFGYHLMHHQYFAIETRISLHFSASVPFSRTRKESH